MKIKAPPAILKHYCLIILVLLTALGVSACSAGLVRPEQPTINSATLLSSQENIGQSFTPHLDGLDGVLVHLAPGEAANGSITLHLRTNPQSATDLRSARLPIEQVSAPGFYRFAFPPIKESAQENYYLLLEIQGQGSVQVGTGYPEAYIYGALYRNGAPQEEQLSFNLAYRPAHVLVGLLQEVLVWCVWLFATAFLFVIPGWALLSAAWHGWDGLCFWEKLGLGIGASLAIYPVLFVWTDLVGLHLGRLYAWLPPLIGLAWLGWRNRRTLFQLPSKLRHIKLSIRPTRSTFLRADALLVVIILLIFASRFWAIRSLIAPMWGDSYQHSMIAQLILDNRGLFSSWEPYVPYQSLTTHFGFSADAALFAWLTGMPAVQSVLIIGQAINGLAIVALLPLAVKLGRGNRWAGAGALIVAGLLSPMPAFYVNWGRFAQLAGQAILPAVLWLTWDLIDRVEESTGEHQGSQAKRARVPIFSSWPQWILASLLIAGMLLTYYRMAFYYITFLLAWTIGWTIPHYRLELRRWFYLAIGLFMAAISSVFFLLPWLLRTAGGKLSGAIEGGLVNAPPLKKVLDDLQAWRDLGTYLPDFLLWIILAAVLWSLVRKRWELPALALWIALLVGYFLGKLIHLPGANMLQNFAILIALYIPVGLLAGWLIGEIAAWLTARSPTIGALAVNLALLALACYGAVDMRAVANPAVYNMVTQPDLRAMEWIRQNTPTNSRFLVEGWRIYEGSSSVGSDAGWWIPLLTERANTIPPQYALLNEVSDPPEYTKRVTDLIADLEVTPAWSPEGIQKLCEYGITYLYVGQAQGKVGFGAPQLFSPADLAASPGLEPIYHQDRVYIFALKPGICTEQ